MNIIPLPAFRDNYIWLVHDGQHAVVVDPGDAGPVLDHLARHGLELCAVLVTHHHPDHVGGLQSLLEHRQVPVFGPIHETIVGVSHPVGEGDTITLPGLELSFQVLEVPAHTVGHIAYFAPGVLFCGDTLFSAGCGRLFEGTAAQLQVALTRLAALDGDTRVYCTHEYTLSNLAFARVAEPDNPERDRYLAHCEALRAAGKPTLPTTIAQEKRINPFLRTEAPGVIAAVTTRTGERPATALDCLTALRSWKDAF